MSVLSTYYVVQFCGEGSSRYYHAYIEGGWGKKYPKMHYVVCEQSLILTSSFLSSIHQIFSKYGHYIYLIKQYEQFISGNLKKISI